MTIIPIDSPLTPLGEAAVKVAPVTKKHFMKGDDFAPEHFSVNLFQFAVKFAEKVPVSGIEIPRDPRFEALQNEVRERLAFLYPRDAAWLDGDVRPIAALIFSQFAVIEAQLQRDDDFYYND